MSSYAVAACARTRQCLLDRVTTDCRGATSRSVVRLVGRAIVPIRGLVETICLSTTRRSDVLAHVAGIPVEEALLAAPALLAGVTVIAGYVRATAARPRR